MKITVKLFAMLGKYLPPGSTRNQTEVEVADGTTPEAVAESLGLPKEQCHLVLVNGVYVEPSRRAEHPLGEGDALAIWPPVAGG